MRFFLNNFIDLLFPPTCVRCQDEGSWLCGMCRNGLPDQCVSWCPVCCAEVVEQNHPHVAELGFHGIFSWLSYHTPWVERAIQDIKFGGLSSYAGVLGTELAARCPLSTVEQDSCIITAIPLSKKRQRERGFNQAEVLAHAVSKSCGIRYERLLQRNKPTKAQAKLSAEERFANVEDAFQLLQPRRRGISRHCYFIKWRRDPALRRPILRRQGTVAMNLELSGKTCILVDDVVTTGATLSAAASMLRNAGADRVIALTLAYAKLEQ